MRIDVEVTTDARLELLAIVSSKLPDEGDAVRFAALYVEDMVKQFQAAEGPPPASDARRGSHGTIWWKFADGIWANYSVATRGSRLLGGVRRTITVFGFEENPPGR